MVRLRDSNPNTLAVNAKFQFRHGAIKSEIPIKEIFSFLYFNSDMVRLRDFKRIVFSIVCTISIPTWCD